MRHMQFDRHTLVLLVLRPDAPLLPDDEAAALQDRHLAFRADLRPVSARRRAPLDELRRLAGASGLLVEPAGTAAEVGECGRSRNWNETAE